MPVKPTTPHSVDSLTHTAEEFTRYAEEIRAVAERMKLLAIESLEITNNDQRVRGLEYADNFAAAARKAIREAQDARYISTAKTDSPPKSRVRKPASSSEK